MEGRTKDVLRPNGPFGLMVMMMMMMMRRSDREGLWL
jgi:hypothetical protein